MPDISHIQFPMSLIKKMYAQIQFDLSFSVSNWK